MSETEARERRSMGGGTEVDLGKQRRREFHKRWKLAWGEAGEGEEVGPALPLEAELVSCWRA